MDDPPDPGTDEELRALLDVLSRSWTLELLRRVDQGPARFGELAEATENRIAKRVLSDRLKALVGVGLIERREETGPPRRIRYVAGGQLRGVLACLERLRELAL